MSTRLKVRAKCGVVKAQIPRSATTRVIWPCRTLSSRNCATNENGRSRSARGLSWESERPSSGGFRWISVCALRATQLLAQRAFPRNLINLPDRSRAHCRNNALCIVSRVMRANSRNFFPSRLFIVESAQHFFFLFT